MISYLKKNYSIVIIILFTIIYLSFLSNNQTGDSFANAYCSSYAIDLFRPHHLLYNVLGYIVINIFSFIDIEPIKLLQIVNVFFASGCLFVLRRMLKRINQNENLVSASILFCACCFGFERFAIDNECYIIPLFFTLLALNYIQSFLIKNLTVKIILCALFLSIGCLFHQLTIWALIAAFIIILFNKRTKYIIFFCLVCLIIPITYSIIIFFEQGSISFISLFNYILSDYKSGVASLPILKEVFFLSLINLVRTFAQFHGYMFEIIKLYPALSITVIIISVSCFVFGIYHFFKLKARTLTLFQERRFVRLCWCMSIFYFAFAAFSNGNAEFMVILPFLITLLLAYYYTSSARFLLGISSGLLIWNLWFGLIPLSYMKLNCNKKIAQIMNDNKDAVFILKEKAPIENIFLYQYSARNTPVIYNHREITKKEVDKIISQNKTIYTDIFAGVSPYSRAAFVEQGDNLLKLDSNLFKPHLKFTALGEEKMIYTSNKP